MSKGLRVFLHVGLWAFMFLSPLSFWRGNGMPLVQYAMNCMMPLLMMVVFYANYFWLTPHHFVKGKRRYYLLFNLVMVVVLGSFLHSWMAYTHSLFAPPGGPGPRHTGLDSIIFTVRDCMTLAISAAVATAVVLASRMQHNEDARLAAEKARVDAELRNLRSQVNPHFLLNTLNNIYALTAFDTARAQDAIQQLSKLLRHMLYDNQQNEVLLRDEVQFLDNYVSLMKIRLPENVDVQFSVSIANPEARVAPLLFISLVENAFKHGISPTAPSFVHISISEEPSGSGQGDCVVCQISNSNYPKTQLDRSGHGIGLQQVRQRLDIAYPGRYEWDCGVSGDGSVYQSTIKIRL